MPREKIDLPYEVEYLSILNAEGELDESLEPAVSEELLLKLHRAMVMGRKFDERLLHLQRQGRIGTFAPTKGQEASQLGAVAALKDTDWMVPCFREAVAEVFRGRDPVTGLLYYGGYDEGGAVKEGLNNMPIAVPVGSQMLHAAGLAYGMKLKGTDQVAMTFFGDGATSEGDFHEALNFAGVFQLPVVFVCQNNHWAISVPLKRQTNSKTIAQKALAYDIRGIRVDGNDILAVYAAAKEAVDRARKGEGPTLIEAVTYRMSVHTTADDPKKYRSEEEVAEWEKKDPITRFEKYLKDKGLLDDEKLEKLQEEITEEIQQVVDQAEAKMKELGDPLTMFDHMYEEMPPLLQEQKEELREELQWRSEASKEAGNG